MHSYILDPEKFFYAVIHLVYYYLKVQIGLDLISIVKDILKTFKIKINRIFKDCGFSFM